MISSQDKPAQANTAPGTRFSSFKSARSLHNKKAALVEGGSPFISAHRAGLLLKYLARRHHAKVIQNLCMLFLRGA